MLSQKIYAGPFNLNLLCEELFDAFPEWVNPITKRTLTKILSHPSGVRITYDPAVTDVDLLDSLIAAHNPNGPSRNERQRRDRALLVASVRPKFLALGFTPQEIALIIG